MPNGEKMPRIQIGSKIFLNDDCHTKIWQLISARIDLTINKQASLDIIERVGDFIAAPVFSQTRARQFLDLRDVIPYFYELEKLRD